MMLEHPLKKTKIAFLMSVEKLFENSPAVYFWTFTFKEVLHDFQAMYLWNQFMRSMKNAFPMMHGLRVVEVHPGTEMRPSHGLHFHCLLAPRMNVQVVQKVGKRWGFGRMHVQLADKDSAYYLAKYLTKKGELEPGARRWGTVGGFHGVKVRNIEIDCILTRNIRRAQELMRVEQFGYAMSIYIYQQTMRYGAIADWPTLKFITPERAWSATVKEVTADDDGQYYETHRKDVLETSFLRVKTNSGWKNHEHLKPATEREPF